jgi:hypothetical protein
MVCPCLPVIVPVSLLGECIGRYIGIQPPPHFEGRILSAIITVNLIGITVIALKALFNISLCVAGEGFSGRNIALVGTKISIMWIIYSIGVNCLLNRYVFLPSESSPNHSLDDPSLDQKAIPIYCQCKKA